MATSADIERAIQALHHINSVRHSSRFSQSQAITGTQVRSTISASVSSVAPHLPDAVRAAQPDEFLAVSAAALFVCKYLVNERAVRDVVLAVLEAASAPVSATPLDVVSQGAAAPSQFTANQRTADALSYVAQFFARVDAGETANLLLSRWRRLVCCLRARLSSTQHGACPEFSILTEDDAQALGPVRPTLASGLISLAQAAMHCVAKQRTVLLPDGQLAAGPDQLHALCPSVVNTLLLAHALPSDVVRLVAAVPLQPAKQATAVVGVLKQLAARQSAAIALVPETLNAALHCVARLDSGRRPALAAVLVQAHKLLQLPCPSSLNRLQQVDISAPLAACHRGAFTAAQAAVAAHELLAPDLLAVTGSLLPATPMLVGLLALCAGPKQAADKLKLALDLDVTRATSRPDLSNAAACMQAIHPVHYGGYQALATLCAWVAGPWEFLHGPVCELVASVGEWLMARPAIRTAVGKMCAPLAVGAVSRHTMVRGLWHEPWWGATSPAALAPEPAAQSEDREHPRAIDPAFSAPPQHGQRQWHTGLQATLRMACNRKAAGWLWQCLLASAAAQQAPRTAWWAAVLQAGLADEATCEAILLACVSDALPSSTAAPEAQAATAWAALLSCTLRSTSSTASTQLVALCAAVMSCSALRQHAPVVQHVLQQVVVAAESVVHDAAQARYLPVAAELIARSAAAYLYNVLSMVDMAQADLSLEDLWPDLASCLLWCSEFPECQQVLCEVLTPAVEAAAHASVHAPAQDSQWCAAILAALQGIASAAVSMTAGTLLGTPADPGTLPAAGVDPSVWASVVADTQDLQPSWSSQCSRAWLQWTPACMRCLLAVCMARAQWQRAADMLPLLASHMAWPRGSSLQDLCCSVAAMCAASTREALGLGGTIMDSTSARVCAAACVGASVCIDLLACGALCAAGGDIAGGQCAWVASALPAIEAAHTLRAWTCDLLHVPASAGEKRPRGLPQLLGQLQRRVIQHGAAISSLGCAAIVAGVHALRPSHVEPGHIAVLGAAAASATCQLIDHVRRAHMHSAGVTAKPVYCAALASDDGAVPTAWLHLSCSSSAQAWTSTPWASAVAMLSAWAPMVGKQWASTSGDSSTTPPARRPSSSAAAGPSADATPGSTAPDSQQSAQTALLEPPRTAPNKSALHTVPAAQLAAVTHGCVAGAVVAALWGLDSSQPSYGKAIWGHVTSVLSSLPQWSGLDWLHDEAQQLQQQPDSSSGEAWLRLMQWWTQLSEPSTAAPQEDQCIALARAVVVLPGAVVKPWATCLAHRWPAMDLRPAGALAPKPPSEQDISDITLVELWDALRGELGLGVAALLWQVAHWLALSQAKANVASGAVAAAELEGLHQCDLGAEMLRAGLEGLQRWASATTAATQLGEALCALLQRRMKLVGSIAATMHQHLAGTVQLPGLSDDWIGPSSAQVWAGLVVAGRHVASSAAAFQQLLHRDLLPKVQTDCMKGAAETFHAAAALVKQATACITAGRDTVPPPWRWVAYTVHNLLAAHSSRLIATPAMFGRLPAGVKANLTKHHQAMELGMLELASKAADNQRGENALRVVFGGWWRRIPQFAPRFAPVPVAQQAAASPARSSPSPARQRAAPARSSPARPDCSPTRFSTELNGSVLSRSGSELGGSVLSRSGSGGIVSLDQMLANDPHSLLSLPSM